MHDNTSTPLMKFSDPDNQRACCSECHTGTVATGGIVIQPLGQIWALESCTGGMGDTAAGCLTEVKVFEEQEEFARNDPTSKETFLNAFAKGHQPTLDAKKNGQFCFQPHFAESNKKFKGDQTLRAGHNVLKAKDMTPL
jgi:hypothetical protein